MASNRLDTYDEQLRHATEAVKAKANSVEEKKTILNDRTQKAKAKEKEASAAKPNSPLAKDSQDSMYDYWHDKEKPNFMSLHKTHHLGAGASGVGRCATKMSWLQRALGCEVKGDVY